MSHTPEPLNETHNFDYFECGERELESWAQKHALKDHKDGRSATHVWTDNAGEYVVGYYTLLPTITRVDDGIFARLKPSEYQGREVAGVLIGKLALDQSLQGEDRGIDLLGDAVLTATGAMDLIGGRHVLVDPMRDRPRLRAWYVDVGFKEIDGSDRLYLDIRG